MVSPFFDLPPLMETHNLLPPDEPAHVDQSRPDYAPSAVISKAEEEKVMRQKPLSSKTHKEPKSRGPSPKEPEPEPEPEGVIVLDDDYNGEDVDTWLADYAESRRHRKLKAEEWGRPEEETGRGNEELAKGEENEEGGDQGKRGAHRELEEEEEDGRSLGMARLKGKVKAAPRSPGIEKRQPQGLKRMRESVRELRPVTRGASKTHKQAQHLSSLDSVDSPPHLSSSTKKRRRVSTDQGIAVRANTAGSNEKTIDRVGKPEGGAEREKSSSVESESHFDGTFLGHKSPIATGVDDGHHSSKVSEEPSMDEGPAAASSSAVPTISSPASEGNSKTREGFSPRTPRNGGYALRSNPNALVYTPETGPPKGASVGGGGKGVSSPATPFSNSKMAKFYKPVLQQFHGEQPQLMDDDQYQEILDEAEDALAKAKKQKGKEIPTKYAECGVCTGMDDFDSLLHCTVCHGYIHPQCMARVTLDDYDYLDDWVCENCHPEDTRHPLEQHAEIPDALQQKEKILRARICEGKNLQFLIKSMDDEPRWVSKDALKNVEELAKNFLFSLEFARLIAAKNVLPSLFPDEKLLPNGVTELTYRFSSNGAYFGIKQYLGVFSEETLQWMEKEVDMTMFHAAHGSLKPGTSDYQSNMKRSKFFFGYGYVGYQYGKRPMLIDDVDPIPQWIQDVVALLEDKSIFPKKVIDQAVLNVYHDQGAGLGVHQDPLELFSRPIYSVRLFSESVLSFGCRGLGMVLRKQAIPLPRGAITVMECFAANKAKHCVRPSDVHTKSASLLLRSINPTAKEELMQRKGRLHRVLSPPDQATAHRQHPGPHELEEPGVVPPSARTRSATAAAVAAAKKPLPPAPPGLLTPESEKRDHSPQREQQGSAQEPPKEQTSAVPPKASPTSPTVSLTSPPKTPVAPPPKPAVDPSSSPAAATQFSKPSVHKKTQQPQKQPQQQQKLQQQPQTQPRTQTPSLDSALQLPSVADLDLDYLEPIPPIPNPGRDFFWERQRYHNLRDLQLEAQIEMHEQKLAQLLWRQHHPSRTEYIPPQPLETLWPPQVYSEASPSGWPFPYPTWDSANPSFGMHYLQSPATQQYFQPQVQQPPQHHPAPYQPQEQRGPPKPTPPVLPSFQDVFLSDQQQPPLL